MAYVNCNLLLLEWAVTAIRTGRIVQLRKATESRWRLRETWKKSTRDGEGNILGENYFLHS